MPFGLIPIDEISLIAAIDGPGCGEESVMGFYGLVIWMLLAVYLMIGQFVICEEYFVPILAQLGDRWNMSEDVQGATLLAVGSSSPELFTALLGVIFYPDDNPGPGTNVGSAVFNMCIIIGLSAIFAPRTAKLQLVPFLRDSIAYMIGLIELYLFYAVISVGVMELWESLLLVGWWVFYVFMVYRTDLLTARCCCCIPSKDMTKTMKEMELSSSSSVEVNDKYRPLSDKANSDPHLLIREDNHRAASVLIDDHKGHRGVLFDARGQPVADTDQNPDNIRIAPGAMPNEATIDRDLQNLLDELNNKQRQNVNKGWVVVVMPSQEAQSLNMAPVNHLTPNANNHCYVRRRTLMETINHEKNLEEQVSHHDIGEEEDEEHHGKGSVILHRVLKPWTKIFGWTLPAPEGEFAVNHIYLTILAIVTWLGILTFFVVDCSEKIGECFKIPGGLLGITLLAIGSSLPDCISSVIVARQMKIDMAVANAFGSNIFDVNLCVGFAFMLGSIANLCQGESSDIDLGDGHALLTFSELIIAAAGFLVFLWLMMWCTLFRLERWMGYILCMGYVGYICVFTTLFVHDHDEGDDFGES